MKKFRGQGLVAWVLLFVLLVTSVGLTSLADLDPSSGATNPVDQGSTYTGPKDPNCNAVFQTAWLVYIEEVENTHMGELETDKTVTTWSQCKKSAIDEMRFTYPKAYMEPDPTLANRCFITRQK